MMYIIILHTLNIYNAACQLYLNKTGKKQCNLKMGRQRQISHDISFICGIQNKNDTSELIYKTEIDPQT